MSQITVYKDDSLGTTAVSNLFIDKYMIDANDAQIKVYLYLVRMMEAKLPTGISDMADKFNHTEKDICRALKHWESMGLISLEYNDSKALTGIRFTSPSEAYAVPRPLAPIVPLKLVSDEESSSAGGNLAEESAPVPVKKTYTRDQLKEFKANPETSQILFVAEMYLKTPLTPSDMETLYFIHYELNFSCELIDYLLQYCIEHGRTSFTSIKKVAFKWAEKGVRTPDDAKKVEDSKYAKEVYTILKALGRNGYPTETEAAMVTKWYTDYALPLDVISEACERTVIAVDSHRLEYCDKILTSWYKAKVTNLNDVAAADASFSSSKKASSVPNSNKSAAMIHTDYDFDEIEKLKLKESF